VKGSSSIVPGRRRGRAMPSLQSGLQSPLRGWSRQSSKESSQGPRKSSLKSSQGQRESSLESSADESKQSSRDESNASPTRQVLPTVRRARGQQRKIAFVAPARVGVVGLKKYVEDPDEVAPPPGAQSPRNATRFHLSTARKAKPRNTDTADEHVEGRWRSSRGRLLTLDEKGPHNRAHDRRASFPPPPKTSTSDVPRAFTQSSQSTAMSSKSSRVGTGVSSIAQRESFSPPPLTASNRMLLSSRGSIISSTGVSSIAQRESFSPPLTALNRMSSRGSIISSRGMSADYIASFNNAFDAAGDWTENPQPIAPRGTSSSNEHPGAPFGSSLSPNAQVPTLPSKPVGPLGIEFMPMSWEDPFIPERRAQLERSRRIRLQLKSHGGAIDEQGRAQTARESRLKTAGGQMQTYPLSARLSAAAATRKSSQSSRLLPNGKAPSSDFDNMEQELTLVAGMVAESEQQLHATLDMLPQPQIVRDSKQPQRVFDIPWHIPTKAENSAQRDVGENIKQASGDHVTQYLGNTFEQHLRGDVLDKAMQEVRWGDRKVSQAKCGLKELDESYEYTIKLNQGLVQTMAQKVTFRDSLTTTRNKTRLLEGLVHSHCTVHEAREFLENINDASLMKLERKNESVVDITLDPNYDVNNLSSENLDIMLKNVLVMKERGRIFNEEQKRKYRRDQKSEKALQSAEEREELEQPTMPNGKNFMQAYEVMSHAAFHSELDYLWYKTTLFKQEVTGQVVADPEAPNFGDQFPKSYKRETDIHYICFSVLSAENLPIMDESKKTNDAYVRCSLYIDNKLVRASGQEQEQSVCTKVAWDTRKPVWNEDFTFTVPFYPEGEVYLLLEVMDVTAVDVTKKSQDELDFGDDDDDNHVTVPADLVLGHVKFCIMAGGIQVMSPEQEITDSYLLQGDDDEMVRYNFGIANAVLKGKSSLLQIRHLYTKR
jgi:hypothetical protein